MSQSLVEQSRERQDRAKLLRACSGDFRKFLQEELSLRIRTNSQYSLRSFARLLGISAPYLSLILSGKRKLNRKTILKLGKAFGLSPYEMSFFVDERAEQRDLGSELQPENFRQIAFDHFQAISDWHHYAILELTKVKGFKSNVRWVARVLGISPNEVNAAIERLVKLEMLAIKRGVWVDVSGELTNLDNEYIAIARRKLQKQILEKAIDALESLPSTERDQSSMTFAMDSSLLPEAKRRLTNFRRKLTKFLESGKSKDKVFHLSLSLYPVTNERNES